MEWTEDVIARLRDFWTEGHSTAEIGRRLSVSKNAVVGKAHRLNLPARPSPIRRDGAAPLRPAAPRRVAGPTLPPLASAPPGEPGIAARTPGAAIPAAAQPRPARIDPPAPPRPVALPRPHARVIACCWPIGEPGTPSFHFCDATATPGKPYCEPHAQLAYVRVKDRREDAA